RNYAVKTPIETIKNIDFTKQKITQIAECSFNTNLPLSAEWEKNTSQNVHIYTTLVSNEGQFSHHPHYYVGGLPALMQAYRKLDEDPDAKVVFIHDGKIPKSMQSGHQAHCHPSEWSAPECQMLAL